MIQIVGNVNGFPKKPLLDWRRGTPEEAAKAYPDGIVYVYKQEPTGTLVFIDPNPNAPVNLEEETQPEPEPIQEPAPDPDPIEEPTQAAQARPRLSDVLGNLTFEF